MESPLDGYLQRVAKKKADLEDQMVAAWLLDHPGKEPVLCSRLDADGTTRFWIEEREMEGEA